MVIVIGFLLYLDRRDVPPQSKLTTKKEPFNGLFFLTWQERRYLSLSQNDLSHRSFFFVWSKT